MRPALRLLATASKQGNFLEAGAPTGLTGLYTHSAPRSTLLYLYSSTLEKLGAHFPESSVYRQSTEALTRHRMSIVERVKPAGLSDWQTRVQKIVDEHPEAFRKIPITTQQGTKEFNIVWKSSAKEGMQTAEWDDEVPGKSTLEGPRSEEEQKGQVAKMRRDPVEEHRVIPRIEPEPPLSAEQVQEIEGEVGSGLIEEVVQVAEGELELVSKLAEAKV